MIEMINGFNSSDSGANGNAPIQNIVRPEV